MKVVWIKFYKTRRSVIHICDNIFFTLLPKGKESLPFGIIGTICNCRTMQGLAVGKNPNFLRKSEMGDSPEKVSIRISNTYSPLCQHNLHRCKRSCLIRKDELSDNQSSAVSTGCQDVTCCQQTGGKLLMGDCECKLLANY